MASVSVSHLIIFIASMLVAASVAGTLVTGVEQVSTSVDDQSDALTDQIDTDIAIISDPASGSIYAESDGESTVTLLVKNTGRSTLDARSHGVDVLVDGQYVTVSHIEVVSDPDGSWSSGEVAEVVVKLDRTLSEDSRAVVTVNGNREAIEFRA